MTFTIIAFFSFLRKRHIIVFTENTTFTKSTKSRISDSSVSHGTNSNWDFGLIWMCIEEFEFLDMVDFGVVTFAVKSTITENEHIIQADYIHWHSYFSQQRNSHIYTREVSRFFLNTMGIEFLCGADEHVRPYIYIGASILVNSVASHLTQIHMYMYISIYIFVYWNLHMWIYIFACMNIRIYIYIYTYIYIYI